MELWLRDSTTYSNFMPQCVEPAFSTLFKRSSTLQDNLDDICSSLVCEVREVLDEYKGSKGSPPSGEFLSPDEQQLSPAEMKILRIETTLNKIEKTLNDILVRVDSSAVAVNIINENIREVVKKHREFSRNLLCHLRHDSLFDPNTPGSSLVRNPFVFA